MTVLGRMGMLGSSLITLASSAGLYAVRTAGMPAHELYEDEDFDAILRLPKRVIHTEDDVSLVVREAGSPFAPLTVVFVHGYCLRMQSWHLQYRHIAERWGRDVRMVFFDQRGHGESGASGSKACTIAQLGRDLGRVIDATAPTGPVVVVGTFDGWDDHHRAGRAAPRTVRAARRRQWDCSPPPQPGSTRPGSGATSTTRSSTPSGTPHARRRVSCSRREAWRGRSCRRSCGPRRTAPWSARVWCGSPIGCSTRRRSSPS